jgi:hypothetical protein
MADYPLGIGDFLLVAPGIAHMCVVDANSILLGATEFPYADAAENDTPFEMDAPAFE